MPPPYYPLYRDWDVYLTRVRFSSLATRSSFVSRVELLQHAPGITSRMFPACDVSQNALTLTDPSSALNSFKGPALEVTPALPSSVPPQHQSTLQNEQIQFFYHVLRYQRAMHRPAILEASGIRHQFPLSGIRPSPTSLLWVAAGERTFAPLFSGSAIGFARHSRKGKAAYGRGATEPLCPTSLDRETRSRPRVRSSRFARRTSRPSRPLQPITLLLPESPLRRCPGLHRADHLLQEG